MPKDNPMKERRKAIDYCIMLLEEKRRVYAVSAHGAKQGFEFGIRAQKHVDEINSYIQLLTAMKDEGPLL